MKQILFSLVMVLLLSIAVVGGAPIALKGAAIGVFVALLPYFVKFSIDDWSKS